MPGYSKCPLGRSDVISTLCPCVTSAKIISYFIFSLSFDQDFEFQRTNDKMLRRTSTALRPSSCRLVGTAAPAASILVGGAERSLLRSRVANLPLVAPEGARRNISRIQIAKKNNATLRATKPKWTPPFPGWKPDPETEISKHKNVIPPPAILPPFFFLLRSLPISTAFAGAGVPWVTPQC
jgi:hypothetical protein